MDNKLNDEYISRIVYEVKRPFKFVSMLEQNEPKKCGSCRHLERRQRLIDFYYEPYFVCDITETEINWPYRDLKPEDCDDYEFS